MRWRLHGLTIDGQSNDEGVRDHWRRSFASLRPASGAPDLSMALDVAPEVPAPPPGEPQFRQGGLLQYTLDGRAVIAHFPRFGQLRLDLARGTTQGQIVPAALATYGVFEDLVAIGLSPHLRRRGLFLIHAFAAASAGRAVLIVGAIGSGKTTTGMALLNTGWKLLSNDSPIVAESRDVLSYPGLLAAYPDAFARFPATAALAASARHSADPKKLAVAAETIWPDVWIERAPTGAILFPQIESRNEHGVEPVTPPEALRRLLSHAVEQWDRDVMPEHLRVLRLLVESAPAFVLRLGPDALALPALLASLAADD